MKLSKFQTILLIVFGACAVSGVLIFAFAVGGGNNGAVGPVTIWGTFDATTFNAVVRNAAESNPDLSQVSYEQKDEATYEQDLTDALANGRGPDIFIMRQDYGVKDTGKVAWIGFSSLSQEQFKSTFVEAAETLQSANLQATVAIPFLVDPLVMYWNRDLLSSSGYAKPPSYWDEVVPMATYVNAGNTDVNKNAVTRRDQQNAVKKSAIAFGEYQNVTNAKDILAALIMQAGGSIVGVDSSGHLVPALSTRTGAVSQPAETALRFYTGFADPAKNAYSWNRALPESQAAFASGDVGLYAGYASEEIQINRMNPNLNFAPALLPQIRGVDKQLTYAHVYALATSRASKNPSGAIAVAYLLAATNLSQAFATAYHIPSARRDVLAQPSEGDSMVFNRAAIMAKSWIDPDPEKTSEVFRDMIERTTANGEPSVPESVSRADQELAHILGL